MTALIAGIAALIVIAGALWLGRRAWRQMDRPLVPPPPYRPQPRQIANQIAADAYADHHPRVHSARFVRRRTFEE